MLLNRAQLGRSTFDVLTIEPTERSNQQKDKCRSNPEAPIHGASKQPSRQHRADNYDLVHMGDTLLDFVAQRIVFMQQHLDPLKVGEFPRLLFSAMIFS